MRPDQVGAYKKCFIFSAGGYFAEEPAKGSSPFGQLLGGGKKAAREADKGTKQVVTVIT